MLHHAKRLTTIVLTTGNMHQLASTQQPFAHANTVPTEVIPPLLHHSPTAADTALCTLIRQAERAGFFPSQQVNTQHHNKGQWSNARMEHTKMHAHTRMYSQWQTQHPLHHATADIGGCRQHRTSTISVVHKCILLGYCGLFRLGVLIYNFPFQKEIILLVAEILIRQVTELLQHSTFATAVSLAYNYTKGRPRYSNLQLPIKSVATM